MAPVEPHILCTAPLSDELVARAARSRVRINVLPFIRNEHLITQALRNDVARYAQAEAHVIFTSSHAVEAVHELLPVDLTPSWTIHCVGERTRAVVNTLVGGRSGGHTAPYATDLAQALIAEGTVRHVLFFCGDHRLDTLTTLLRAAGINVDELVVYSTITTPQRISDVPDGILFLSPSAVESFFSLNSLHASTVPFAIGLTTAEALARHTQQHIILPHTPSRTALIDAACAHFTIASA